MKMKILVNQSFLNEVVVGFKGEGQMKWSFKMLFNRHQEDQETQKNGVMLVTLLSLQEQP